MGQMHLHLITARLLAAQHAGIYIYIYIILHYTWIDSLHELLRSSTRRVFSGSLCCVVVGRCRCSISLWLKIFRVRYARYDCKILIINSEFGTHDMTWNILNPIIPNSFPDRYSGRNRKNDQSSYFWYSRIVSNMCVPREICVYTRVLSFIPLPIHISQCKLILEYSKFPQGLCFFFYFFHELFSIFPSKI